HPHHLDPQATQKTQFIYNSQSEEATSSNPTNQKVSLRTIQPIKRILAYPICFNWARQNQILTARWPLGERAKAGHLTSSVGLPRGAGCSRYGAGCVGYTSLGCADVG